MTDPTAARDRAIEAVAEHRRIHRSAWRQRAEIGDVADALLAHPEVLRDLAGAPTADVAEIERLRRIERAARSAMFDRPSAPGRDELRALLAATPEGVDAADELDEADTGNALDRAIQVLAEHSYKAVSERIYKEELNKLYERGRELTAAQAAIQRVRERHRPDHEGDCEECYQTHPCPTVRALDGDTTEES